MIRIDWWRLIVVDWLQVRQQNVLHLVAARTGSGAAGVAKLLQAAGAKGFQQLKDLVTVTYLIGH